MANAKKQLTLKKFMQHKSNTASEDCEELQEEIKHLQEVLNAKHNELFQMQRDSYRHKLSPPKKKEELFVRPEKIILSNSIDSLQRDLELMSMLSGMEVQSYEAEKHCAIVYHMQHDAPHQIKHGLLIDMTSGNNFVSKSSLPYGFNLTGVLEGFDNVMLPECLGAVRKALVAYYDRLDQFQKLKKILHCEADLVKNVDATHVEVSFAVRSHLEETEDPTPVTLLFDYRLYDIRPKQTAFIEQDLPEGSEALKEQCVVFKRKPLANAFRDAFFEGVGPYLMVKQFGAAVAPAPRRRKHKRQHNVNYNNDDTFRPEDCSESEDDIEQ